MSTSNFPFVSRVVDIIPQSDSAESNQNSEPSIGVNPINPMLMIAGTFGDGLPPFFISTDGGTTWSIFGTLFNNNKSIAWNSCCAGHPLRDPNWLLGGGFYRSRCWLGYHYRIGNRLRNIDGFRAGLMGTNHARPP